MIETKGDLKCTSRGERSARLTWIKRMKFTNPDVRGSSSSDTSVGAGDGTLAVERVE